MDDEDEIFDAEVQVVYDKLCKACDGHGPDAIFRALSELAGAIGALSIDADFNDLMRLLKETAEESFDDERADMRREMN
jgi:hypothetical protein